MTFDGMTHAEILACDDLFTDEALSTPEGIHQAREALQIASKLCNLDRGLLAYSFEKWAKPALGTA